MEELLQDRLTCSLLLILVCTDGQGEANKAYTEEDWMEPETLNAYGKSKTMAEKAAWEYVKELPGIKKNRYTFRRDNFVSLFCLPSEKEPPLKGQHLLP